MKISMVAVFAFLAFAAKVYAAPVEIQVRGVKATTGSIFISMFNSSGAWDKEKPTGTLSINPVMKGTSKINADLPEGEYAFFLYHDVNNDGKLETNIFGMPTEPYTFSNNVKINMSKPSWQEIHFVVKSNGAVQTVELK